ncbi:unnamed protein product, partial [Vitis vinifera]|uniref:Uncharacterized protein n=1 Tax=Vitis vinifera TaxID=29760 RepID=D7SRR3_VITVI
MTVAWSPREARTTRIPGCRVARVGVTRRHCSTVRLGTRAIIHRRLGKRNPGIRGRLGERARRGSRVTPRDTCDHYSTVRLGKRAITVAGLPRGARATGIPVGVTRRHCSSGASGRVRSLQHGHLGKCTRRGSRVARVGVTRRHCSTVRHGTCAITVAQAPRKRARRESRDVGLHEVGLLGDTVAQYASGRVRSL